MTEAEIREAWGRLFRNAGIEEAELDDPVEHPAHYELPGGIEVYDVIAATQSREELIGYCKGNVKKYVLRADRKGGPEDHRKARWYLEKLIELEEA